MDLTCYCSEIIVKNLDNGDRKIRAKVLIVRGNSVYAICKACNHEVKVPLTYQNINPILYIPR